MVEIAGELSRCVEQKYNEYVREKNCFDISGRDELGGVKIKRVGCTNSRRVYISLIV